MAVSVDISDRLSRLEGLRLFIRDIDSRLQSILKDLNWDYDKIINEIQPEMVTCTLNIHHRVPKRKIQDHEKVCRRKAEGYHSSDNLFSEPSNQGSYISINEDLLYEITKDIASPSVCKASRSVPNSSAYLDQNFSREEKLAIYNYVISNTKKQNEFTDLCLEQPKEKEEKKELSAWEIAAAERDAKRRRASYRNKVHTSRKTQTEILREVIDVQMEMLKFKASNNGSNNQEKIKHNSPRKHSHKTRSEEDSKKFSSHDSHRRKYKDRRDRYYECKGESRRRSSPDNGNDSHCRSRSHDKHRKWKSDEGRSHSRKSSRC